MKQWSVIPHLPAKAESVRQTGITERADAKPADEAGQRKLPAVVGVFTLTSIESDGVCSGLGGIEAERIRFVMTMGRKARVGGANFPKLLLA